MNNTRDTSPEPLSLSPPSSHPKPSSFRFPPKHQDILEHGSLDDAAIVQGSHLVSLLDRVVHSGACKQAALELIAATLVILKADGAEPEPETEGSEAGAIVLSISG